MKYLLIIAISSIFLSIFAINTPITTVQAMPPCDNDLEKPCFTIPAEWFKLRDCPGCPPAISVLDLIRLVDQDGILGNGGVVNVALTHGPDADILTLVLPKDFSLQNSSMMGLQNSSMITP